MTTKGPDRPLDRGDLLPLLSLLSPTEPPAERAAAAEVIAAGLPLTVAAWAEIGDRLVGLLDDPAPGPVLAALARAAAHVPRLDVRERIRATAADGGHPACRAASRALADVGDATALTAEVTRLLRAPLTDAVAHRLASLPMESLHLPADRIPAPRPAARPVASWWTALAAARLGRFGRLDRWLARVAADPGAWPLPPGTVAGREMWAVQPLPAALVVHLSRVLDRAAPVHASIARAWLHELAEPGAPGPADVHGRWLDDGADPAGWAAMTWELGRAGPRAIMAELALGTPLEAVRDALAWMPYAGPPVPGSLPPPPALPGPLSSQPVRPGPPTAGEGELEARYGRPGRSGRPSGRPPAYAVLTCPHAVVVETPFDVEVGLGPTPARGTVATPLSIPDDPFRLTVQVLVDGFSPIRDRSITVELDVSPDDPFPTAKLGLTAAASPDLDPLRTIQAVYSVDGRIIGAAERAVLVVADPRDLPADTEATVPSGADTALPAGAHDVDLAITISHGNDRDGATLLWTFQSPHAEVPGSAVALQTDIGARPEDFARTLMRSAGRASGRPLRALMAGVSRKIAAVIPPEVRAAVRAAVAMPDGPPAVLLLTADPFVPWELADVGTPHAPALLGVATAVGRWALPTAASSPALRDAVEMRAMAAVGGRYERVPGFNRLEHAEQEIAYLADTYQAEQVDARVDAFFDCLEGNPEADVLHVALHGKSDQSGLQDGLILVDGTVVEPLMIGGQDLAQHPFVFLNACQVGQAAETLGQYGGMAQAFVEAGASAVVAPLWVVRDDEAFKVSAQFYEEAFGGASPAMVLRAQRATPDDTGTRLAYVLYGHPRLRLSQPGRS